MSKNLTSAGEKRAQVSNERGETKGGIVGSSRKKARRKILSARNLDVRLLVIQLLHWCEECKNKQSVLSSAAKRIRCGKSPIKGRGGFRFAERRHASPVYSVGSSTENSAEQPHKTCIILNFFFAANSLTATPRALSKSIPIKRRTTLPFPTNVFQSLLLLSSPGYDESPEFHQHRRNRWLWLDERVTSILSVVYASISIFFVRGLFASLQYSKSALGIQS